MSNAQSTNDVEDSGVALETDVVFSIDLITIDGTERSAGATAKIPSAEARELILRGRARAATKEDLAPKEPAKKSAPRKRAASSRAKKPAPQIADSKTPTPTESEAADGTGEKNGDDR